MTDDVEQTVSNPIDVHLGQRVRKRRRELKLSQEALSDELDISFQQVQKYENGTNRISAATLLLISHALAVPLEYFFGGLPKFDKIEDDDAERRVRDFMRSQEGVELAAAFSRLSADKRRFVLNTVKGLIGLK